MKIQVLGSGCPTCKNLFETTKKIVEELKLEAEVEYITDVSKMIEMGVMESPVLAIDGKPVLSGGSIDENAIKEALQKDTDNKDNSSSSDDESGHHCAHCGCC